MKATNREKNRIWPAPKANPFTPGFGSVPPVMAGRRQLIDDILQGLANGPGDPYRTTIFVGPRGSGKTALMVKIAEEASQRGWIVASTTAIDGMLDDIYERAIESAGHLIDTDAPGRITGIGVGGFSLSREFVDPPKGNWRTRMNRLLDEINGQGVGLLVTVDEINIEVDELRLLAATFQHFVGERRNAAILMAGLPSNVLALLQDKKVSFLRKAFQEQLGAIDSYDVKDAMKKTIELSGRSVSVPALNRMTEVAGGFPFLMQVIGYNTWRQHPENKVISIEDAADGIEYSLAYMGRMIFDTTLRELSDTDKRFLIAMAEDEGESRLFDVAKRMGETVNYASQYRNRLIEQGVIGVRGRGLLAFDIPMLRDYLINNAERLCGALNTREGRKKNT
jgi:hypothetical protein